MASDIHNNYCLICSAEISSTEYPYLDKLEAVFLLKVLLHIPQESELISQVQSSLNLVTICEPCYFNFKQCKQIYLQISAQIEKLWKLQDNILRKIQTGTNPKSNQFNSLADQCRGFAKKHNLEDRFKYPFVYDDLSKLLISDPDPQPLAHGLAIKTDPELSAADLVETDEPFIYDNHPESLGTPSSVDPLDVTSPTSIEISDIFVPKYENPISNTQLEFENEDDDYNNYIDEDNDKSDQDESSEEEDDTPPQIEFKWNPSTGRFHCLDPSCPKTNVLKKHIENHFYKEHYSTYRFPQKKKITYKCTWPSCGKIFRKPFHHRSHMDKHKGTPSLKCKKCGRLFYYKSGLHSHQNSKSCRPNPQQTCRNIEQFQSKPAPKLNRIVKNTRTGKYHCHYRPCSKSFLHREEIKKHLILHLTEQNKDIVLNREFSEFGQPIVRILKPPVPPTHLTLTRAEVPCTIISDISSYGVETNQPLNYTEDFSRNQLDSVGELPSSSCGSSSSYPATPDDMRKRQLDESDDEDYNTSEHSSEEDNSRDFNYQSYSQKLISAQDGTKSRETSQRSEDWNGTGINPIIQKYYFKPNPLTGKFHCLDPSCSTKSNSKKYISHHYRIKHLKTKENESFPCNWPGCGKVIGDKKTYQFHMDKHRGTPQNECEECGDKFYWSRGLARHKIRMHAEGGTIGNKIGRPTKRPKICGRNIQEIVEGQR